MSLMSLMWGFLDKLANNFFLLAIMVAVSLLVVFAVVALFNKNKTATIVFSSIALVLTVIGMVLFNNMKQMDNIAVQLNQINNSITQHQTALNQLDKEVQDNYEQFKKIVNSNQQIQQNLNNQLNNINQIKPTEVKNDEEVLDAFDYAASYTSRYSGQRANGSGGE